MKQPHWEQKDICGEDYNEGVGGSNKSVGLQNKRLTSEEVLWWKLSVAHSKHSEYLLLLEVYLTICEHYYCK